LRGEVFDVAIDLRRSSPTFLHWHGEILSAENKKSYLIPEGFAHGFQALTDDCELLYLHTAGYAPHAEGGIHPQDERVGIEWPLGITDISNRDSNHPRLDESFVGLI
jgi:dTDP-4-dehydrorhamnose 3,5-epimerase